MEPRRLARWEFYATLSYEGLTTDATGGAYIAWNLSNLDAEMDFVCDHGAGGGGGFNWYNVCRRHPRRRHDKPRLMTLDESGRVDADAWGNGDWSEREYIQRGRRIV